jgi:acetyl-CoA decarbonylase/synthase complex subunit beta
VKGFLGIGIQYFYSPKFIQSDGGWRRVVWMASDLKARVKDAIPEEMRDKIATEKDVRDIESLREFLKRVDHPVVNGVIRAVDDVRITEGWGIKVAEAEAGPHAGAEAAVYSGEESLTNVPLAQIMAAGVNSPVKIILKDADIHVGKIIIRRREEK